MSVILFLGIAMIVLVPVLLFLQREESKPPDFNELRKKALDLKLKQPFRLYALVLGKGSLEGPKLVDEEGKWGFQINYDFKSMPGSILTRVSWGSESFTAQVKKGVVETKIEITFKNQLGFELNSLDLNWGKVIFKYKDDSYTLEGRRFLGQTWFPLQLMNTHGEKVLNVFRPRYYGKQFVITAGPQVDNNLLALGFYFGTLISK